MFHFTLFKVQSWINHPGYNTAVRPNFDNDFAIIKLSTHIQFSSTIRPVCLPQVNVVQENVEAVATGWGRLWKFAGIGGSQPDILQKVSWTKLQMPANIFYKDKMKYFL